MCLRRSLQSPVSGGMFTVFAQFIYRCVRVIIILVHAIRMVDAIKATAESLKEKDMKATIDNIIGAALIVVEAVNDLQHIPE